MEWGNLRAGPDHARVTAVEDFYRGRLIYRLTRAGEAAEAALGTYDATRCWGGAGNSRRSRCTTASRSCGRQAFRLRLTRRRGTRTDRSQSAQPRPPTAAPGLTGQIPSAERLSRRGCRRPSRIRETSRAGLLPGRAVLLRRRPRHAVGWGSRVVQRPP
nr:DUF2397 family protein [Streptomyces viridosporus]